MTSSNRSIVVAVDNSEFAEHAFLCYVANIARVGDYVIFVHIPEHQDLASSKVPGVDLLLREVQENTNSLQHMYMTKLDDLYMDGEFKVASGKPGEAIIKIARDTNSRVIVTGSRGQGKIRRALLGSVSGYIIHHSPVPVLVYRDDTENK